jgi:hypothetical protein
VVGSAGACVVATAPPPQAAKTMEANKMTAISEYNFFDIRFSPPEKINGVTENGIALGDRMVVYSILHAL